MKEYISIIISKDKESESDLIIDLLKSDGWKIDYQCEDEYPPVFIHTKLVRD